VYHLQFWNFFAEFWLRRPALLYGFTLLLSLSSAVSWHWSFCFPIFLLLLSIISLFSVCRPLFYRHFLLCFLISFSSYFYASTNFNFPELPSEGIAGRVIISIDSVSSGGNHFSSSRIFRGSIKEFTPYQENSEYAIVNVPFTLFLPISPDLPLANCSYEVRGSLKQNPYRHAYILKVKKKAEWHPIEGTWSFAQSRFDAKERVKAYIHHNIKDNRSATFLSGLATGEFNDRSMLFNFGRLGLQHIMAISGFHFSIITSLLSFLLGLFLLPRKAASLLIFCLAAYFIFLGCGPSIQRAWVSSLIILLGVLFEKRCDGLNVLGMAILATLFANPLNCESLGFHFSFLTTGSILLFHSSLDSILKVIFNWKPLSRLSISPFTRKCSYIFSSILRQGLSLLIAVHLAAIPAMLFFFHKFPWMGLLYNLFFPFLVSLSLALLLLACLFGLLFPPLSHLLHGFNNYYTSSILELSYNVPPVFDVVWRTKSFQKEQFIFSLCLLFLLGIFLRFKRDV
jgi:competence protein ComEC